MNVKGGKWKDFKKKKMKILKFLIAEYNKQKHEAIFDEDHKRAEQLDEVIKFISAFNDNRYYCMCPMCGSRKFMQAEIKNVNFVNEKYKEYPQYKSIKHYDTLHISVCDKCGWYTISEF